MYSATVRTPSLNQLSAETRVCQRMINIVQISTERKTTSKSTTLYNQRYTGSGIAQLESRGRRPSAQILNRSDSTMKSYQEQVSVINYNFSISILELEQSPIRNILLTIFEKKKARSSFTYPLLNELFPVISSPSQHIPQTIATY